MDTLKFAGTGKTVANKRYYNTEISKKIHAGIESAGKNKVNDEDFIFIRDSNVIRRLKLDDILYAKAMGDYVKLYTPQKNFAIHTTLKVVEERLPASKFIRVHRSYIVAITKIDTIQDGALVLNGKPVPVADTYRASLNKKMNVL